ncbi:hypothetical protein [Roseivirga pacifica]|uniref:hypothetical protein n=1 Tax=Roseivirga pacifica TaxID=1267423 RepID=UPI003BAA274B
MNDQGLRDVLDRLLECLSDKGITPKIRGIRRVEAIDRLENRKKDFDKIPFGSQEYEVGLSRIKEDFLSHKYYAFFEFDLGKSSILGYIENSELIRGYKNLEDDIRRLKRNKKSPRAPELEKLDFYALILGFSGAKAAVRLNYNVRHEENYYASRLTIEKGEVESNQHRKYALNYFKDIQQQTLNLGFHLGEEYLNELVQLHVIKNRKEAISDSYKFLNSLFTEVLNSKRLSYSLMIKIELLFNSLSDQFAWPHRAILASAISLSVLDGWEDKKVQLLKRLLEWDKEPIVYERALLGIFLCLLKAYPNKSQYQKTVEELSFFQEDEKFKAGIFIYYNSLILNDPIIDKLVEDDLHLKRQLNSFNSFKFFEPIHKEASYLTYDFLNKSKPELVERLFWTFNLNALSSRSSKLMELERLDKFESNLTQSIENLCNKWSLKVITNFNSSTCCYDENTFFLFKQALIDFKSSLLASDNFNGIRKRLNALTDEANLNFINALFEKFPHRWYLQNLPYDHVYKHLLLDDACNLEYIADFNYNKALESRNISFLSEAIIHYERLIGYSKLEKSDLLEQLGKCWLYKSTYENRTDFSKAVTYFHKALKSGGEKSTLYLLIGHAHFQNLNFSEAKRYYLMTIKNTLDVRLGFNGRLQPNAGDIASLFIGHCYICLNNIEDAVNTFEKIVEQLPYSGLEFLASSIDSLRLFFNGAGVSEETLVHIQQTLVSSTQ